MKLTVGEEFDCSKVKSAVFPIVEELRKRGGIVAPVFGRGRVSHEVHPEWEFACVRDSNQSITRCVSQGYSEERKKRREDEKRVWCQRKTRTCDRKR